MDKSGSRLMNEGRVQKYKYRKTNQFVHKHMETKKLILQK